jgi:hypothetical protein
VPAPFTRELCGYRTENGNPNMSDANDGESIRLGRELLAQVGVPPGQVGPSDPGAALEVAIVRHLRDARPDLVIERSRRAADFAQYAHLKVFPAFRKGYAGSLTALSNLSETIRRLSAGRDRARLEAIVKQVSDEFSMDAEHIETLKREMPEESLLGIDVSVAIAQVDGPDELAVALSAKWSLRTDRAQNCVSQESKLVAQRRGRMPHFAMVTVETRPAMLWILADGSGAVDWVYHLDLPALQETIAAEARLKKQPETWSPRVTFDRLMDQRRLRDFDDLVRLVEQLPERSKGVDK